MAKERCNMTLESSVVKRFDEQIADAKARGLISHDNRSAYIESLMRSEIDKLQKMIDVDKLQKVGFTQIRYPNGECWVKTVKGEELTSFFAGCPEILRSIKAGEFKSIYLEMYPSNFAQFAFMDMEIPGDGEISNIGADDYQITDYDLVMRWIDQIAY